MLSLNSNINSIQSVLKNAKKQLYNNKIETFSLDAEVLLMHILNISRVELITKSYVTMSLLQQQEYYNLIQRRIKHEPVQYIVNRSEFMSLDFYVDNKVLIPRSDTECLVEEAINYINKTSSNSVIDMCTGSGCISISLLKHCNCINKMLAVDISEDALCIAKKNAKLHNVLDKLEIIKSDMFLNIPHNFKNKIDVIISNPPYIDTHEISNLGINVKNFEPIIALDGKDKGLFNFKVIAKNAKLFLKPHGKIFLEIGYNQGELVKDIFLNENYKNVIVKKDLSGLDRVVVVDR